MAIGSIWTGIRTSAAGLADLLLPEVCNGCGGADVSADALCTECNIRLLELVSLPYCPRCGSTLGPNVPVREDGCAGCPTVLPPLGRVFRLGPYADPLRRAIHGMKYHRRFALRRRLAELLAGAVQAAGSDSFDVVVPVPMHWWRRLRRGVDHAGQLANDLARGLDLPAAPLLRRIRNTPLQTNLSRTQRLRNVKGAFQVADRPAAEGANVLLVDDVTTTGATAGEAARTLRAGGASRVSLAVIAKSEAPTAYASHWRKDRL